MVTNAMNSIVRESMAVTASASSQAQVMAQVMDQLADPTLSHHEHSSRVYESDVLVQLKANLAQLEDLHARMQHLMGEIGYLTKAT